MPQFSHLHCHTQYSLLDGAASISDLYKKASADGMKALAITDHGNMYGVFQFVAEASKYPDIKPIVGCEFYVVADRHRRQFTKDDKDRRYHQLMLAKNPEGYKNLVKLCSLGYVEGLYGKYPRIDKELILKYHEGLIATTCCLGAEVPQMILRRGEDEARKTFEWWLDLFGEDYYIELQRHGIADQERVNAVLLKFAKEYNVKMICSNDSHYVDQDNSNAHDILLCINTGEKQATPVYKDYDDDAPMPKGSRFGFFNDQFYFKTQAEMGKLFKDIPEALDNTQEIVDKVEHLKLKKDILLPNFVIPQEFTDQDEYLRHITYEGARKRYGDITPDVQERLDFELFTVKTMGFAGYFLIVSDFIRAGRDLGVFVGPGRGSAAGSAVAYCIGITNIDPIKYNLLFERFLNPDRKSMPDIDTDFDDEGRQKVIDYVVNKYGQSQVAHIVTYGTMAAKMSIKDVSRVLDLPLDRANALAKLVPEKPGIELDRVINAPLEGEKSLKEKENLGPEDIENAKKLRDIAKGNTQEAQVLHEALILEGSVRGTGIHAAGIIIAPKDLTEIIPVCASKDTHLYITQYEGSIIEDAGVIKMDFLGLKTLTIIKEALRLIKQNHGVEISIDEIPLDDTKTYELYQRGETNGTFQFESAGMQKYLRELKPDKFDDLIAMNALYRPGPIEYIPDFIARKHGRQAVAYDLPDMEDYLKETYGICTYQEQVMLLSQKLAGFSKGDADVLRKAMGKKQIAVLNKMKGQFIEGGKARNYPENKLEKIWTDWEAFASYAFNKSHSTCYAFVAYQTAYLKAHYPGEYMAAVMTNNQGNIDKITFFMEECRRMGVPVKGPDVNESDDRFSVNKKGEIRFALSAIKGVGSNVVQEIIRQRSKEGPFATIFEFAKRMPPGTANRKTVEALAYAGALDCFGIERYLYFLPASDKDETIFLEKALSFGRKSQQEALSPQASLFGDIGNTTSSPPPPLPKVTITDGIVNEAWSELERLNYERDVIGLYLSGHPLDKWKWQIQSFTNCKLSEFRQTRSKDIRVAGIVRNLQERVSRKGNRFLTFVLEDFSDSGEVSLFGDQYEKFRGLLRNDEMVFISASGQPGRFDPTETDLRINDIRLLTEELFDNMIRHFCIELDSRMLTDAMLDELAEIFRKHKGKKELKFRIRDESLQADIPLVASEWQVNPTGELVRGMEQLGLKWSVV